MPAAKVEDDDSLDGTPLPGPASDRPRPSVAMGFHERIEQRLGYLEEDLAVVLANQSELRKDLRSMQRAIIRALEGRTRLLEKVLDMVRACGEGLGRGAGTMLDRFTQPTSGFILLWVLTLVSIGGITVSEVFDVGSMVKSYWVEAPTSEPATSPAAPPSVDPGPDESVQ